MRSPRNGYIEEEELRTELKGTSTITGRQKKKKPVKGMKKELPEIWRNMRKSLFVLRSKKEESSQKGSVRCYREISKIKEAIHGHSTYAFVGDNLPHHFCAG